MLIFPFIIGLTTSESTGRFRPALQFEQVNFFFQVLNFFYLFPVGRSFDSCLVPVVLRSMKRFDPTIYISFQSPWLFFADLVPLFPLASPVWGFSAHDRPGYKSRNCLHLIKRSVFTLRCFHYLRQRMKIWHVTQPLELTFLQRLFFPSCQSIGVQSSSCDLTKWTPVECPVLPPLPLSPPSFQDGLSSSMPNMRGSVQSTMVPVFFPLFYLPSLHSLPFPSMRKNFFRQFPCTGLESACCELITQLSFLPFSLFLKPTRPPGDALENRRYLLYPFLSWSSIFWQL